MLTSLLYSGIQIWQVICSEARKRKTTVNFYKKIVHILIVGQSMKNNQDCGCSTWASIKLSSKNYIDALKQPLRQQIEKKSSYIQSATKPVLRRTATFENSGWTMEEMLRQNSLSLQKPLALPVTIQPTTATTKRGEMRTYTSERKGERKECSNFQPKNHSPSTLNTLPVGRKTATVRREEGFRLSAREKEKREMVELLHSKCPPCHTIRPPCPQTLTLSRFSHHRDSANPHCAIFCYLPSPEEPLQKPLALPVTREPTTATTKGGEVRTHTSERGGERKQC